MVGIIENKLSDGSSSYDIRMGETVIWTDADSEETAIKYRDDLFNTLKSLGSDFDLDEEIRVIKA